MVFNATFNNISVISWWSVVLVESPVKTTDLSQVTDKLYHIMLAKEIIIPWIETEPTFLPCLLMSFEDFGILVQQRKNPENFEFPLLAFPPIIVDFISHNIPFNAIITTTKNTGSNHLLHH
jgi:hypothetical protein